MRARNLKPGFFKNEVLADIRRPWGRLLFAGLSLLADREGRLEDRPRRIQAEIFPYDPDCPDVDETLSLLESSPERFIIRYEVNGRRYIQITNFKVHNFPHHTEKASVIPPVESRTDTVNSPLIHRELTADSPLDNGGNPPSRARVLNPESLNPEYCVPNGTLSGKLPDDAPATPPFAEIIAYFNAKTGKRYRANTQATKRHIKARWSEGWRIEDFKRVIDVKCEKWATDPKMIDFLRPETLFGTKFESYLNETKCRDGPRYDPNKPDWVRELEKGGGR
ncbi:MAG TPA: conserved phage C-terminal domain-containing protein [Syntrophobacter fumaroxidans]|nr:conserved phage C-terminal domain-containing protein [Syntrophobacter fumaroxidans]